MKTAAHYESYAAPVLGTRAGATLSPRDTLNACGRFLFKLHQWRFRLRPPALINLTSGQEYVSMPADCGQLKEVKATGLTRQFSVVSIEDILDYRQNTASTLYGFYCALSQPGQTSASAEMTAPRLELWPTPSESVTGAARILYYADWTEITAPSDKVNIPDWMEDVLQTLIPEWAAGLVQGNLIERQDRFVASSIIRAAKTNDGLMQSKPGRVRNGLLSRRQPQFNPYDTTVADPT